MTSSSTGCWSGKYPVAGTVLYTDGTPVAEGTVIAEGTVDGKLVGVQGNIENDGSFQLGGASLGDGALPGTYRAAVLPVTLGDSEIAAGKLPSVDGVSTRIETSGIQFEVKKGKNKIDIQVNKPRSK